jgi:hypothetical protein
VDVGNQISGHVIEASPSGGGWWPTLGR